jgi:thiol-disulfide isomerase/thioredoxin
MAVALIKVTATYLIKKLSVMRLTVLFLIILISCEKRSQNVNTTLTSDSVFRPYSPNILDVDSIDIVQSDKSEEGGIAYGDVFGNIYTLQQGKNKVPFPVLLTDVHGRHQTHFLINNSRQSVFFSLDSISTFWIAKGDDEKLSKELNFEVNYRREVSPIHTIDDIFLFDKDEYTGNPETRKKDIDAYYDKKVAYLKEYAAKLHLRDSFVTDWQTVIRYEKLSARLLLSGELKQWKKEYLLELSESINELNNDQYLYLPYYRQAAWGLVRILHFLAYNTTKASIIEYNDIIINNFKSKTKDYLLSFLLLVVKDKYSEISFTKASYDSLFQHFTTTCLTPEYKEYLHKSALAETVPVKSGQLYTMQGEVADFSKLVQNQRVSYVDFWASWCAPCRAEMPDSKKLREEYRDKGVNFIYISIDQNTAAWERAAKQIGIAASESFLLPKGKDSDMARQFKITAIPRYMIIGEDGRVIDANAPRPSDPAMRQKLDALLSQ